MKFINTTANHLPWCHFAEHMEASCSGAEPLELGTGTASDDKAAAAGVGALHFTTAGELLEAASGCDGGSRDLGAACWAGGDQISAANKLLAALQRWQVAGSGGEWSSSG